MGSGPDWDYEGLVRARAPTASGVLDLGTGGGEVLEGLRPALPRRVAATESWTVNAQVAHRRLAPLHAAVVRARTSNLPFGDSRFDLVISRHEEFEPAEVDRILAPGGSFITQQCGRHDWMELRPYFPRMTEWEDHRARYSRAFEDLGYHVEGEECDFPVAYPSLGEFVYMLRVSPWTIPDFAVDQDLDSLLKFESDHTTSDGLVVTECRYLLVAQKTSPTQVAGLAL